MNCRLDCGLQIRNASFKASLPASLIALQQKIPASLRPDNVAAALG
jgi:hypothetical protein